MDRDYSLRDRKQVAEIVSFHRGGRLSEEFLRDLHLTP